MTPSAADPRRSDQPKELGLFELIAIGVGGMIGGGIFSILGLAVDVSGNAAPLGFLLGSVIAAIAGYSYVRLALTFRSDGASFTYLEKAFPDRLAIAGIAGWTVLVGYIGTLALYAFTFGAYASHLFGVESFALSRPLLSSGSLVLFLLINLTGAKAMGRAEDVAVSIKILLLAILAVVGLSTVSVERMTPLVNHGASSILLCGALVFVAFEGFQLITNAVCETRDPERNVPRGVFGSIAVTSLVYVTIAWVAVGNLDAAAIHEAQEYALAAVAQPILGRAGVVLVDIAALLATASAMNATIFGASHLAYEISKDQLAPRAFSHRNGKAVPASAAIVITLLSVLLTNLGTLEIIASFSSLTFLLVSIAVSVANLRLREQTRAAPAPVYLGMVLMLATTVLLVAYLFEHNVGALLFAGSAYGAVALSFVVFRRLVRARGG